MRRDASRGTSPSTRGEFSRTPISRAAGLPGKWCRKSRPQNGENGRTLFGVFPRTYAGRGRRAKRPCGDLYGNKRGTVDTVLIFWYISFKKFTIMVSRRECFAHKFEDWRFEWYFDEGGDSPAREYYEESLNEAEKDDLTALFEYFATRQREGKPLNEQKVRDEGEEIFAFKPTPHRLLWFYAEGKTVILTHGFKKKRDKLPPKERRRAKEYRADYFLRNTKGLYYAEKDQGAHQSL